jgi:hypothetical protein
MSFTFPSNQLNIDLRVVLRKQTQQKINYFFKSMNVSNQHEPGPSCSKD